MCVLRLLQYSTLSRELDKKNQSGSEMQQLSWLVIHGLSWPEMLRRFCHEQAAVTFSHPDDRAEDEFPDTTLRDLAERVGENLGQRSHHAHVTTEHCMFRASLRRCIERTVNHCCCRRAAAFGVDGGSYWKLPSAQKVEALRFVCEALLDNETVQHELERRVEKMHDRNGRARTRCARFHDTQQARRLSWVHTESCVFQGAKQ